MSRVKVQQLDQPILNSSLARQAIINGNFDVWQRGTSFTPANGSYEVDRFVTYFAVDGGTNPTLTSSRQPITPGELDKSKFFYRLTTNGAGTGYGTNALYLFQQRIENGTRLLCGNGKKVTLSFYAKSDIANKKIGTSLEMEYGAGGSPTSTEVIKGSEFSLTNSWAKYTTTFTTNTLSGKTFGTDGFDHLRVSLDLMWGATRGSEFHNSSGGAESFVGSGNIDIAQVQLCAGDVALPFMPKSFDEELRACQRYYVNLNNSVIYTICAVGSNISTTQANLSAFLPVQTRINIPTLDTLTASQFSLGYGADGIVVCTDLVLAGTNGDACNTSVVSFKATVASGLTAGRGNALFANASSVKLGVSYEL